MLLSLYEPLCFLLAPADLPSTDRARLCPDCRSRSQLDSTSDSLLGHRGMLLPLLNLHSNTDMPQGLAWRALPRQSRMEVRPLSISMGAQVRVAGTSRSAHDSGLAKWSQPQRARGHDQLPQRAHGHRECRPRPGLHTHPDRVHHAGAVCQRGPHVGHHQRAPLGYHWPGPVNEIVSAEVSVVETRLISGQLPKVV